jgi:hypothetical protein
MIVPGETEAALRGHKRGAKVPASRLVPTWRRAAPDPGLAERANAATVIADPGHGTEAVQTVDNSRLFHWYNSMKIDHLRTFC